MSQTFVFICPEKYTRPDLVKEELPFGTTPSARTALHPASVFSTYFLVHPLSVLTLKDNVLPSGEKTAA